MNATNLSQFKQCPRKFHSQIDAYIWAGKQLTNKPVKIIVLDGAELKRKADDAFALEMANLGM